MQVVMNPVTSQMMVQVMPMPMVWNGMQMNGMQMNGMQMMTPMMATAPVTAPMVGAPMVTTPMVTTPMVTGSMLGSMLAPGLATTLATTLAAPGLAAASGLTSGLTDATSLPMVTAPVGLPAAMAPVVASVASTNDPEAREGMVLLLRGLPVQLNVSDLFERIKTIFGTTVNRFFPFWNKGHALVGLANPVRFSGRKALGLCGVEAEVSPKPSVNTTPPSSAVNARFFFLNPETDYQGTPEQVEDYKMLSREWIKMRKVARHGLGLKQYLSVAAALPDHRWKAMLMPVFPNCFTEQMADADRRMYTQLFYEFASIDDASDVVARCDGLQVTVMGLKAVVRLHHIEPHTLARAPGLRNPGAIALNTIAIESTVAGWKARESQKEGVHKG